MPTANVRAVGTNAATDPLGPMSITRRDPGPTDVALDILFCGVCHSDIHTARNEWKNAQYPCVPGHEIIGRVTKVGEKVTKYKVGDITGVGCMVDSCRTCGSCSQGLEQFCTAGTTLTYNSPDKHLGGNTFGGYSTSMVVDEAFVFRIPDGLDLAATAPLLCAGITLYSPLRKWQAGPGKKVGIVGLGGLGHMGVKLARAMGAHVVLFTTSPSKVSDGSRLGAHEVVVSKEDDSMAKHSASFDLIIDCVSANHDMNMYLQLVKLDGTLVSVGVPADPIPIAPAQVCMPRRILTGSLIGGVGETQEMLDFCAKHGIVSDIEVISADKINESWERVLKQDVKFRFVIDMASMKE